MHKRGLCRPAVSVCLSVCLSRSWIMSKWINISSNFFSLSGSHSILVFTPNGVAIFRREPPNGRVECKYGIGRNRDSGLTAGYQRLLDVQSVKTFTVDEAKYMTQLAMHYWLSIDCWTCERRSVKNSYRRPCSVDRTSECLFVTACSMDQYTE